MAIIRGSTHKLVTIKEVTYGTTPATPVMLEIPIVNFSKKSSINVLKSAQIRSHPYIDKMLQGQFMHEIGIDWELQDAVHDSLLETVFGGTIATKALAFADVLKSVTAESQAGGGSSLFDQFPGTFLNKLSITASASDTAPVRMSASGMAKSGTLDAAATLATSVTAAANNDPFVFCDASLTVSAAATAVVAGTVNIERTVDPLYLWNSRVAREYIPSDVAVSGTITVPYDTNAQSTIFTGFTDAPLVFKFANNGATTFRQFTIPKTKFVSLGRQIQSRGGIFQEVNWEAYYDPSSTTIMTMTTQ